MNSETRKEWAPLVGEFMLSCGDIELQLLQLYWNMRLNSPYDNKIKLKTMGKKTKYILEIVNDLDLSLETKKRIRSVINKTIKLSKTRNLVAHSPLSMDVYTDKIGNFDIGPNIRSLRNPENHISKEFLEESIREAHSLYEELYDVMSKAGEECSIRPNKED